ncbi:unnamed protein product [Durusdinium trenchii]|uniref:Uncharacterized protein n=1 Tax=Durusdinium trenchii TaxID=1381693 RepID=A0ABP0RAK7_9DINO
MEQVKLILESEKCAQLPSSEHHSYEDKFSLVERATLLTLASQVNVLSSLGLTKEKLRQAKGWAEASQVSIRFRAEERCSYLREETREVEDPTFLGVWFWWVLLKIGVRLGQVLGRIFLVPHHPRKRVTDVSVAGMSMGFTSKKLFERWTVTKVTEFFWKLEVSYELELFRGVGAESSDPWRDKLMLQSRTCNTELKTTSKVTPHPEAKEANITFLLRQLDDLSTPSFQIDRAAPKTKTPRRNPEVEQALGWGRLSEWCC